MLTLETAGLFTWSFNCYFHIETPVGNFEWSDPDYGGDNTITLCGSYEEWLKYRNLEFGRDKGWHHIGTYCGNDVKLPTEGASK